MEKTSEPWHILYRFWCGDVLLYVGRTTKHNSFYQRLMDHLVPSGERDNAMQSLEDQKRPTVITLEYFKTERELRAAEAEAIRNEKPVLNDAGTTITELYGRMEISTSVLAVLAAKKGWSRKELLKRAGYKSYNPSFRIGLGGHQTGNGFVSRKVVLKLLKPLDIGLPEFIQMVEEYESPEQPVKTQRALFEEE